VRFEIRCRKETSCRVTPWLPSQIGYRASGTFAERKSGRKVDTVSHISIGGIGRTLTRGNPGERNCCRYDAGSERCSEL